MSTPKRTSKGTMTTPPPRPVSAPKKPAANAPTPTKAVNSSTFTQVSLLPRRNAEIASGIGRRGVHFTARPPRFFQRQQRAVTPRGSIFDWLNVNRDFHLRQGAAHRFLNPAGQCVRFLHREPARHQ